MQKLLRKSSEPLVILVVILFALASALYVVGNSVTTEDNDDDLTLIQHELRGTHLLMSMEEKAYHKERSLSEDYRPTTRIPVQVKGIYVSGRVFNAPTLFKNMLNLVEETELNSLVIDIKDDDGNLSAVLPVEFDKDIKPKVYGGGKNTKEKMDTLYAKGIYPIARIVVFKDPILAESKKNLALKRQDGLIWRDKSGLAWVDPHNKEVWEYTVNVAKGAAMLGFREIQFDYVRFPTDGNLKNAVYPYATGQKMEDVINEFLAYAQKELEPYNVFLSADVFGLTTLTTGDMGMGQKYEKIISEVDYVCPMVYPSHYGRGNYGFQNPNAYPYEIVKNSLLDGLKRMEGSNTIIRPWLQSFSLGSPAYGAKEIREQIEAVYDAGLNEWILWNAGNKYNKDALQPD